MSKEIGRMRALSRTTRLGASYFAIDVNEFCSTVTILAQVRSSCGESAVSSRTGRLAAARHSGGSSVMPDVRAERRDGNVVSPGDGQHRSAPADLLLSWIHRERFRTSQTALTFARAVPSPT